MTALGEAALWAYRNFTPGRIQAKFDEDAVKRLGYTYNQDGLATLHNADFLEDPKFKTAFAKGVETTSWGGDHVKWRNHVYIWAGSIAAKLDGDFVECGVNKGGHARSTIEYIDFGSLNKKWYLMDTYDGLVDDLITPEEKATGKSAASAGYTPCLDQVRKTFAPFKNVVIVPGAIPGTLSQVTPEKVSFLSIDMNCVVPEKAALAHFWPRIVPGGFVLLDDYGFAGHEEQKKSHDAFAASMGTFVLSMPTGQGMIVKN